MIAQRARNQSIDDKPNRFEQTRIDSGVRHDFGSQSHFVGRAHIVVGFEENRRQAQEHRDLAQVSELEAQRSAAEAEERAARARREEAAAQQQELAAASSRAQAQDLNERADAIDPDRTDS